MAMLPAHVKTMRPWLEQVDEIVIVDSHSHDGTPEYLQKHLRHPNVRLFQRPRGLYQAWNFGIEQTTGDWIYISTVGDGIFPPMLKHLIEVGESLGCGVVCSRPNFVDEKDRPVARVVWPIDHILRASGGRKPVRLAGVDCYLFALLAIPNALLGSSASNVYRGAHLRTRPFPTEFGTVGDTAWSLRYGLETVYGFTPECGTWFRLHEKSYSKKDYAVENLAESLAQEALRTLRREERSEVVRAGISKSRLVETARAVAEQLKSRTAEAVAAEAS